METIPVTEARSRIAELAETLDILSDDKTLGDLHQSREDFTHGDVFEAEQVRAELERRRSGVA